MSGLGDFDQLVGSDPTFAGAWGEIQNQLQAEGGNVTQINSAKIALTDSYEQLSAQGFGLSGADVVNSAKQYVLLGQTVAGAANVVQGLAGVVQGADPIAITQAFTGTLVGVSIAAGALSAGVGAAIVGGVGALLSILQNAGFFGARPGRRRGVLPGFLQPAPCLYDIQRACASTRITPRTRRLHQEAPFGGRFPIRRTRRITRCGFSRRHGS